MDKIITRPQKFTEYFGLKVEQDDLNFFRHLCASRYCTFFRSFWYFSDGYEMVKRM